MSEQPKKFYENALSQSEKFAESLVAQIPELQSVGIVFTWDVPGASNLPAGVVRSNQQKKLTPTTALELAKQLVIFEQYLCQSAMQAMSEFVKSSEAAAAKAAPAVKAESSAPKDRVAVSGDLLDSLKKGATLKFKSSTPSAEPTKPTE